MVTGKRCGSSRMSRAGSRPPEEWESYERSFAHGSAQMFGRCSVNLGGVARCQQRDRARAGRAFDLLTLTGAAASRGGDGDAVVRAGDVCGAVCGGGS